MGDRETYFASPTHLRNEIANLRVKIRALEEENAELKAKLGIGVAKAEGAPSPDAAAVEGTWSPPEEAPTSGPVEPEEGQVQRPNQIEDGGPESSGEAPAPPSESAGKPTENVTVNTAAQIGPDVPAPAEEKPEPEPEPAPAPTTVDDIREQVGDQLADAEEKPPEAKGGEAAEKKPKRQRRKVSEAEEGKA